MSTPKKRNTGLLLPFSPFSPVRRKLSPVRRKLSPVQRKLSPKLFQSDFFVSDNLLRANSFPENPLKSSSTECGEHSDAPTGSFFALSRKVASGYGKYIHIFMAKVRLRIIDMSSVDGYHLLRNLIETNTAMSESDTVALLARFDEAYVLHPGGKLARISDYENDRPLFCGLQFLYSKGVFGAYQGVGNSERIGTFHPEVYVFSLDLVEYLEVSSNTSYFASNGPKKTKKRPRETDEKGSDCDTSFQRKLF
jgi:hypothetical protein